MSYANITDLITATCDAIRTKTETTDLIPTQQIPQKILSIPTGSQQGDYSVRFLDYDGTVIKEFIVNEGDSVTPPTPPIHEGLTFQEWNYDNSDFSNISGDLDVGATYITSDGATWLDIELTNVSTTTFTIGYQQNYSSLIIVEWGDGTQDGVVDSSTVTASHTYPTIGKYRIKLKSASNYGAILTLNSFSDKGCIQALFCGYNMSYFKSKCFSNTYNLSTVCLSKSITLLNELCFSSCYSLKAVIIPSSVTNIKNQTFQACYGMASISLPKTIIELGQYALSSSGFNRIVIPPNVTSFSISPLSSCYSLKKISNYKPSNMANNMFANCYNLEEITFSSSARRLNSYAFQNCYRLKQLRFPFSCTYIPSSVCQSCNSLKLCIIESNVTSIDSGAFSGCTALYEVVIYATTPPTLSATNGFPTNSFMKIYVPDESVNAYKEATNWVTFADYIYPVSQFGGQL